MVAPYVRPSLLTGRLYLSKGRLRVDLGPFVTVYFMDQQKGWEMFPGMKQYVDIGEKRVSTFLPHLKDGSPCPYSERPSDCKRLGGEVLGGRQATKWMLASEPTLRPEYLWTDDQLGIALRWYFENGTYEVTGLHEAPVADNLFEMPSGYAQAPETWRRWYGEPGK